MSNTLFTNFNKLISTEMSEYLIRYTKQNDLLEVADKTGVSFSTINNVRRQRAVLKLSNAEAMTELTRLAIRNYTHRNSIDSRLTKEYEKGVNVRGMNHNTQTKDNLYTLLTAAVCVLLLWLLKLYFS